MAFTPEQESALLQVIAAFENGKSISELPDVQGTNPFALYTEVLEGGESKKAALATLLPYMESDCSYGIEFDVAVSSPACARIGNAGLHKSLPIQSRMKGCLLDDDGNVVEYLNPTGWTGHARDGSRGQVMVEIPMHYRKFETDGTKRRVRISEYPLPGYHQVRRAYVSAYEAAIERSTGKLCSVANMSPDYRGGPDIAAWDGSCRSLLGRPASGFTRGGYRAAARKRNSANTSWNIYTYQAHKTLFWLFAVEYATLNSQEAYNAEPTPEGYRRGGLGTGVSNLTYNDWKKFNDFKPFVPCGHTDSLGNGTGIVYYGASNEDGTLSVNAPVPRYRGIENPFGHIDKLVDGLNIRYSPPAAKGGDGLTKVFTCDDPSKFSDAGYDGYKYIGDFARINAGYATQVIFGEDGDIIPINWGGGSTIYFCDRFFYNMWDNAALLIPQVGGGARSGEGAGFCGYFLEPNPMSGTRLCFLDYKIDD